MAEQPLDPEAESILAADHAIRMAQYHELHNRLEDFTVWMIEMGYLARNAVSPPTGEATNTETRTADPEYLFEFIESYLDEANEHESRGPLDQILHPDMTEFSGEPDVVEASQDPEFMRDPLQGF